MKLIYCNSSNLLICARKSYQSNSFNMSNFIVPSQNNNGLQILRYQLSKIQRRRFKPLRNSACLSEYDQGSNTDQVSNKMYFPNSTSNTERGKELNLVSKETESHSAKNRQISNETKLTSPNDQYNMETKWQKKKVAMWIGYVGTAYRGLQYQPDCAHLTIEGVVEKALFASNFIRESNFGNLSKIGWTRNSRTDKGVHSTATVISFKMEVPPGTLELDTDGQTLSETVNHYLPENVRVFSVVPATRSFSARRACISRTYDYFIPIHVLGLNESSNQQKIDTVLNKFNDILSLFQGRHPFHNYTVRKLYRINSSNKTGKRKLKNQNEISISNLDDDGDDVHSKNLSASTFQNNNGDEERMDEKEESENDYEDRGEESEEGEIEEGEGEGEEEGNEVLEYGSSRKGEWNKVKKAYWISEVEEKDKISNAHFRTILECNCDLKLEKRQNLSFLRVKLMGESFMMHQIRKIVGTAIAVSRGWLNEQIIPISLARHSRIILPLAPSQTLMLSHCEFYPFRKPPAKKQLLSEPTPAFLASELGSVEENLKPERRLELSDSAKERVDEFVEKQVLPSLQPFLDGENEPWKEWITNLEAGVGICEEEMEDVARAWEIWRTQKESEF